MKDEILKQIREFFRSALTTAIGFALIALAITAARTFWTGPIEPVHVLDETIRGNVYPPPRAAEFVNVEYRTRTGTPMDLGPFVHASLRNGQGPAVELTDGYFKVARGRVHAGMSCVITIDGGMHERVQVKVDNVHGGTLYIRSHYSVSEFLEKINGPPAE